MRGGVSGLISKRRRPRRYADIYNDAYRFRAADLGNFLHSILLHFKRAPLQDIRLPTYVLTLVTTQSMAEKCVAAKEVPSALLDWSLRLVRFMEKRAARIITHSALHFLYRAGGPYMRRQVARMTTAPHISFWLNSG